MKFLFGKIRTAIWALCLFFLCADFVSFSGRAAKFPNVTPSQENVEAIVALTGGQNRIANATELAQSHSLPLFISGVFQEATSDDVAKAAGVDPDFFKCCATLGYQAQTTHENALEVAQWAKEQNYSNIIIVTSNYHMERALLEFRYAMPSIEIHGFAVSSPAINAGAWWNDSKSAKRMFVEWSKWRIKKIQSLFKSL